MCGGGGAERGVRECTLTTDLRGQPERRRHPNNKAYFSNFHHRPTPSTPHPPSPHCPSTSPSSCHPSTPPPPPALKSTTNHLTMPPRTRSSARPPSSPSSSSSNSNALTRRVPLEPPITREEVREAAKKGRKGWMDGRLWIERVVPLGVGMVLTTVIRLVHFP